jgi:hypothetical protein
MKKLLYSTLILSLAALVSCNDKEPDYPIDISFTEISVTPTAHWQDANWENKMIFINSRDEMEKFVANANELDINFSKQTLVLARKFYMSSLFKYDDTLLESRFINLQKTKGNYVLNLNVFSDRGWGERADEFSKNSPDYMSPDDIRRLQKELFIALVTTKLSTKKNEIDLTYFAEDSFYYHDDACGGGFVNLVPRGPYWRSNLVRFDNILDEYEVFHHRRVRIIYRSTGVLFYCEFEDEYGYVEIRTPVINLIKIERS